MGVMTETDKIEYCYTKINELQGKIIDLKREIEIIKKDKKEK